MLVVGHSYFSGLSESWAKDGWEFSVLKRGDSVLIPAGCYHRAISSPGTIAGDETNSGSDDGTNSGSAE